MLVEAIRSFLKKQEAEDEPPSGTHCTQCRTFIGSSDEAELLVAGRILLDDVG